MVSSMEREDKINAAELLETVADGWESGEYEWIRRTYRTEISIEGTKIMEGYCSVGALLYHAKYSRALTEAKDALITNVSSEFSPTVRAMFPGESAIVHWNDQLATDKAEVIDRFKSVAKDLRNEAGVTL